MTIIQTNILESINLPEGDESHPLEQESNDKKLSRNVTHQLSS